MTSAAIVLISVIVGYVLGYYKRTNRLPNPLRKPAEFDIASLDGKPIPEEQRDRL